MQELMHLKTGESKSLALALKTKLIKDSSFEDVKEVLRKIMVKVGIRANNLPNDLEKLVLYEHIIQNYGGNRLDEIRLAFDMAIMGTLPDENGEVIDATTFENFSCLYFSKIMNGYRRWSSQEYKHIPLDEKLEQRIFTQEENDNSAREDAERQYQFWLRGNEPKGLEINKPILLKDGLLKEDESIIDLFKRCLKKEIFHLYQPQ